MGATEKIQSIREEMMINEDQASFLVSRGTLQALLYAQEDLKDLQARHDYLNTHRLKLNVKLMKQYRSQLADQKRKAREGEQQRKRLIHRQLRQATARVEELEQYLGLYTVGTELMAGCHQDIFRERIRQIDLRGHQRHPMERWLVYILEEVGEVAQAIQSSWGEAKETDTPADHLYMELIQASALLMAAAEQVREETQHGETHKITKIGHTGSD